MIYSDSSEDTATPAQRAGLGYVMACSADHSDAPADHQPLVMRFARVPKPPFEPVARPEK